MARPTKSTSRKPAAAKAKPAAKSARGNAATKSARGTATAKSARGKMAAKPARGKTVAKSARGKTLARSAAARKSAVAKTARTKKTARKAPAPKRMATQKNTTPKATAKSAARRTAAPRRAATPRPAPVLMTVSATPPAEPPVAAPAASSATVAEGETSDEDKPPGAIPEAVASFAVRAQFRDAVKRLLAAGFAPTDLSVLASHDSLEVAGGVPAYRGKPGQALMSGLTDEVDFIGPLQVAGFSALSGGPVGAAFGALVTVGLGGMALRELIERFVANRHSADYEAALKAGGVLLWVRIGDSAQERKALDILGDSGGRDAHIHHRQPHRD